LLHIILRALVQSKFSLYWLIRHYRQSRILGGCYGNLQGIAVLVKGRRPEEVIATLKGIRCLDKATSCPDQLAQALEQVM
nr:TIGR03905 family TSCPD domain-containing protein [Muribaculaceae bacterium]